MYKKIFLLLFFLQLVPIFSVPTARSAHTEVALLSEVTSLRANSSFWLLFRFRFDPDWHSYWINPGDSGEKVEIELQLPAGYIQGDLIHPVPETIEYEGLTSYGFRGEAVFLKQITTPQQLSEPLFLRAKIKWLECAKICLPAKAELKLSLPLATNPNLESIDPAVKNLVDLARQKLAQPASFLFKIVFDEKRLRLTWPQGVFTDNKEIQKIYFFPIHENLIEHAAKQEIKGNSLLMMRNLNAPLPEKVQGILVFEKEEGKQAFIVDTLAEKVSDVSSDFSPSSLLVILLSALLGGLLLNLMPCVLPVISLKAISYLQQNKVSEKQLLWESFSFAGGILVSFWLLTGLLILIRASGTQIGWGFQLQSPVFTGFFAMALFLFSLNLLGVFEFGQSVVKFGGAIQNQASQVKSALGRNFLNGITVTMLATPCTAPFMGPAIGFALGQSVFLQLLIFTFLGLGLSLPYLIFALVPNSAKLLPKPGAWLDDLRKILGFILLAAVIWLLWIFFSLTDQNLNLQILVTLLILSIAAWIFGRFGNIARPKKSRLIATIIAALLIITVAIHLWWKIQLLKNTGDKVASAIEKTDQTWQKYSNTQLKKSLANGENVFIDFTAKWCLSCQANKISTLQNENVLRLFQQNNVSLMRADWTKYDQEITQAINSYGRQGVPLYVYYANGKGPQLLPEILTPSLIKNLLQETEKK